MAKRRRETKRPKPGSEEEGQIPMTPMIDVVFQLLVYFVFTMKPMDVIAHLNVYTPSTDAPPQEQRDPPTLIRIGIYVDGYTFDNVPVGLSNLDRFLGTLAKASRTQSVLIECDLSSAHGDLVKVLNLCSKHGMSNLSVVSAR